MAVVAVMVGSVRVIAALEASAGIAILLCAAGIAAGVALATLAVIVAGVAVTVALDSGLVAMRI